jgi:hypothetical protein
MERIKIPEENRELLTKQVISKWDISKRYWYPLYDCKPNDVMAFNAEYIEDKEDKILFLISKLKKLGNNKIFEMHEDRLIYSIDISSLDPCYDGRFLERFWFSEQMDWIIYASHEGTITFGGATLIELLKEEWTDWKENLKWDNKN